MRLLLVEDEKKVAAFMRRALEEAGYAVDVAYDGDDGLGSALAIDYDFVILDHLLPGKAGRDVCQTLRRSKPSVPILMVTACDAIDQKVAGLDAGADDYLTKPFSIDELLARVRAGLRRGERAGSGPLVVDDLALDPQTRRVTRGGQTHELSAREFALLDYLMRNARRPVSRTLIAEHVWGFDFDSESNVIDVYISYLRHKIDRPPAHPLIRTIRSIGYQLG